MEKLSFHDPTEVPPDDAESSDITTWDNLAKKAGPFILETSKETKEAKEKQLRDELFKTHEKSLDGERRSLDKVSSELRLAGFGSFSRRVEDYRNGVTRIDRQLCETMVNYMDAKFTDPKAAEKIWDEYSHDTRARALMLENTLGGVRRGLSISGDEFEKPAEKITSFESTIPAMQVGLLKYYKKYFDEPTEHNKNILISQVCGDTKTINGERTGGYTSAVSEGLHDIAESIDMTVYGVDDITYAIDVDLKKTANDARTNNLLSVVKYYECKVKNHDGIIPKKPELTRANKPPESVQKALDMII